MSMPANRPVNTRAAVRIALARSVLTVAAALLVAQLVFLPSPGAAESLRQSLLETRQLSTELAVTLRRLQRETAELQSRILSEFSNERALDLAAEEMASAQLDAEALDARLVALRNRIAQRRRDIDRIDSMTFTGPVFYFFVLALQIFTQTSS